MVLHNCSIAVIFAFENEGKVKDFIIATFKEKYLFISCFSIMFQNISKTMLFFSFALSIPGNYYF